MCRRYQCRDNVEPFQPEKDPHLMVNLGCKVGGCIPSFGDPAGPPLLSKFFDSKGLGWRKGSIVRMSVTRACKALSPNPPNIRCDAELSVPYVYPQACDAKVR